ncbi:receptor-like protein 9DC3 [Salvia hispanica]|uniref:receptor-like protein 9DC3 n=1 Tax=Salvia hispanica TaxID=49212 RepID=UPI0020092951|nr:receptor-like protein 9DC3 [Salvia hispanica]
MRNLGLCGLPLTRKCKDDDGQLMQSAEEEGDDEYEFIDGYGWRSVVMGYGSGFVVGIGIGYMIIRSGRPSCLAATHQINSDEFALLAFKSLITSDPSNILKNNWTAGTSVCTWFGVTCDSPHNRVTHFGNSLHGYLPKEVCSYNNLPRLKELQLSNNTLEGEIPLSLGECPQLEILALSYNNFVGHVPTQIGNITSLKRLRIYDNNLTGSLPQRYFNNFIAMIQPVEIEYDYFLDDLEIRLILKGQDQLIKRLLETFTIIDLSSNRFTGPIPPSIGNLKILKYLNLSHNTLMGRIPSSLGNLSEIESLDLSTNKLDGEIPSELTMLTFLAKVNLSTNNLVGQIPQSNQFSTFENDSYMGNLGLCGLPLTRKCKDDDDGQLMQFAEEEGDDEYEFIDGFGWRRVVMGYGSGVIVGIWKANMVCGILFGVGYKYKSKKRRNKAAPICRGYLIQSHKRIV